MSKSSKNGKVPKLTEEEYARYVASLKENADAADGRAKEENGGNQEENRR